MEGSVFLEVELRGAAESESEHRAAVEQLHGEETIGVRYRPIQVAIAVCHQQRGLRVVVHDADRERAIAVIPRAPCAPFRAVVCLAGDEDVARYVERLRGDVVPIPTLPVAFIDILPWLVRSVSP